MMAQQLTLTEQVRGYWERQPCGAEDSIVGDAVPFSATWFRRVEAHRYRVEPFIHAVAQFTRYHGQRVLEVGVGAGTDHLQWARAGAECYGVDLTDAAIETTRKHLAFYGFESHLQRLDAACLPFEDGFFDLVYSWGVIHHAAQPEALVREILRVLKPGGCFIGMMYGRRSPNVFKLWVRHALLAGRPWRSFAAVVWHHCESLGTKAYTARELRALFASFRDVEVTPVITPYDVARWPRWLSKWFPDEWGWFIPIRATAPAQPRAKE